MIVLEYKLRGKKQQFLAIDEAIRTAVFIRNKCVRYWMERRGVKQADLHKLCAQLAKEFEWARKLNSMARQASAERAWFSITRFYANCKAHKPGKKGYPKFKSRGHSVEYKTTGWHLSEDRRHITFTDGFHAGTFSLLGKYDLHFYAIELIKRVRVVRRADGYYCQFCVGVERTEQHEWTGRSVGIDLGLEYFYTDSDGNTVETPRFLRKSEKALKRLNKRISNKKKGSKNRKKAVNRYARKHLKVKRQRRDFAVKTAMALVKSADLIVYEDLKVHNLVKNHFLAKSIYDAAWTLFIRWVEHYAKIHGIVTVAVPPHYTSQECSGCGHRARKSLSDRTHQCPKCGLRLHRDHNAAITIKLKGLLILGASTAGQAGTHAWGEMAATLQRETAAEQVSS
jgi:putative transposase